MKYRYLKSLIPAVLSLLLTVGAVSCVNDLDISPVDPQVTPTFSQNEVFSKLYAMMSLTGQEGVSGKPDISSTDEGTTSFYRLTFTANEFPTDELIWTWQDAGIPELNFMRWNSSHGQTEMMYNRLTYNITLCNYFLDETVDKTDTESVRQRAEARFIRALHYYYLMDFFGKAPFTEHVSNELPQEKSAAELFTFIENELKDVESALAEPRTAPFGRVDKVAAWLLRARIYLNAEVYTQTVHWEDAITYSTKVIGSGYGLCSNYEALFMADNDENADAMQEMIFPLRQDGLKTKTYGGSFFLVATTRISGMPDWGASDAWSCIRARKSLVEKFFPETDKVPLTESVADVIKAAKDDRALFYSGAGGGKRQVELETVNKFTDGLSVVKWTNLRSDGQATQHDVKVPDTDIPLFRLAEAYLIRAEAILRSNGSEADALKDIQILRDRAHASKLDDVDLDIVLDERARELYFEGFRRTDLIRYGYFTTSNYLWDWKGGVAQGSAVGSIYNLYPVPAADINANKNMHQNPGY